MHYNLLLPCPDSQIQSFPVYHNDFLTASKKITLFNALDVIDDVTGPVREAILNLDISSLKEAIHDRKLSPNAYLNLDHNLVTNISVLISLAMADELIENFKRNSTYYTLLPEENEPLPKDVLEMVERYGYLVERKPAECVLKDYSEKYEAIFSLLKADLDVARKKEKLVDAFNTAYENELFLQDFSPELLKGKKISLLELAVKIRDLDFILCLLDHGAILDPWDWTKGSFFYSEGLTVSDQTIHILETLVIRGIALNGLVTSAEKNLGELVQDLDSDKFNHFLEQNGYQSYLYNPDNDPKVLYFQSSYKV